MERIKTILTRERVITLSGNGKNEILSELCGLAAQSSVVTDPQALEQAIMRREAIMSTGLGMGIAIPHAKTPAVTDFVMAVGRSDAGIDYESLDGLPVHLVILIAASDTQSTAFLSLLGNIGAFFNHDIHRQRFLAATTDDDIFDLFTHIDDHLRR